MKRLKVLISAREFSPYQGSECAVGWNIATRLANYHDVTVLYGSGSQFKPNAYNEAINDYFKKNKPIPGLSLVKVDAPRMTQFISKINQIFSKITNIGLPMIYYIGYNFWQKAAYKTAVGLHQKNSFDVVHQLTQITFREPGYLWKLGIPFIWGPTGGVSVIPKRFIKSLTWHTRIIEGIIRKYSNYFQFMYSSRVKQANQKASVIYAFSEEDKISYEKRAHCQVKLMLDVGTYSRPYETQFKRANDSEIRGIWCGQLIDIKAPVILLKALALTENTRTKLRFTIVGTGPLETSLFKLAKDLQLNNLNWIKRVKHEEIFDLMGQSDFLVHTSIREATSSVIMEAISMGLPVICHDSYGMSIAVNESCGIKIPFISPEESIKGFNKAIEKLMLDRRELKKLKEGALIRAQEVSWDNMTKTIANDYIRIYETVKK